MVRDHLKNIEMQVPPTQPSLPQDILDGGGVYPVIIPSMLHEWIGLVLANTEMRRSEKYGFLKAIGEEPAPFIDGLMESLASAGFDGSRFAEVRAALEAAMAVKSERMVVCRCGCRFALNSFGAGFISAIGHCYLCDARNVVQKGATLQCPDWGPWLVSTGRDGYVALQSETGVEDAALAVSGNFGGDDERKAYAERMAAWLNQQIARESEGVIQVPRARQQHLLWKLIELQSSSCSCLTKSPELKYHAESCRYRVLGELYGEVQAWALPSDRALARVSELSAEIGQEL